MYRKITKVLENWYKDPNKKALLITGARQIGKTYIIKEFAKSHYKNFVEINFIHNQEAKYIFEKNLDAETICTGLSTFLDRSLEPHKTLVFFDEIQECPNARTAIKFLVEDGRYDFIESGSLLGVNYKHVKSFPVGFETIVNMYPMDFEEFCIAMGISDDLLANIKDCYDNKSEVNIFIHKKFIELFKIYVTVGGMPDSIKTYIRTKSLVKVDEIQKSILTQYRDDISQYSERDKNKIYKIFDEIPSELDAKNRRFHLSSISKTARLINYEDAFMWLKNAGVALPCYSLNAPVHPLKINEQSRLFKLYLSDCGLLCAMSLKDIKFLLFRGDVSVNMGSILENVFAQELAAHQFALRYFNKHNIGEVDFIIQLGGEILPIEIKSGKDFTAHASLNNVLNVKEWKLNRGIVFCEGNVRQEGKITYLPWYMIMFLKHEDLSEFKVDFNFDIPEDVLKSIKKKK